MIRFNTITGIVDTRLITSTVITGGINIAAFASGVGLPVGAALSGTSLLLSLATVITQKPFKIFTIKQEKHDAIKLLAQSKLDSIANIISQAMQDGDISSPEFHKVLQDVEKYRRLKADIRNQTKAKVKQITKEQREEILEQGRKEGKGDLSTKNRKFFRYPGCQCHLKYESLPHVILWSIKNIKNRLKNYLFNTWKQPQDLAPHWSLYRSWCYHLSQYFFEVSCMRVFSSYLPSAFDHTHADQ